MSRDINGNYTLPPVINPVVSGTPIVASWANPTLSDVAAALTDSLSRAGSGGMQAALKLVDGTAGAPGLTFSGETTMGLYRISTGTLGISILGSLVATLTSGGLAMAGSSIVSSATITAVDTLNAGNALNLTNSQARIRGDFSNATLGNRTIFQSSTTNGASDIATMPNGTGARAGYLALNDSVPNNSSFAGLFALGGEVQLVSSRSGAAAYLPLRFYTSDVHRMAVLANGQAYIGTSSFTPVAGAAFTTSGGPVQLSPGTTAQPGVRIQQSAGVVTFSGINNDNNVFNALEFAADLTAALTIRTDSSIWTNGNTRPVFFSRAFCSFDGTLAGPISPRTGAGNVSSITKHATGEYTVNFATNMPDVNYAPTVTCCPNAGFTVIAVPQIFVNRTTLTITPPTVSGFRFCLVGSTTGTPVDVEYVCVDVKR